MCFLHFCQLQPPLLVDGPNSTKPIKVKAAPVASVVVPCEKLQAFIDVMSAQLKVLRQRADRSP